MTEIAIDVVLLPSDGMMNRAIEINKVLLKENENKIILHKEKCLPHISLCMGCIEENKIPDIKKPQEVFQLSRGSALRLALIAS